MFKKSLMLLLASFSFLSHHAFAEQEKIENYTVSSEYMSNYKAQYSPPIIPSKPIDRAAVSSTADSTKLVTKTDIKIKLENIEQIGISDKLFTLTSSGKGNLKEALKTIIPKDFNLSISSVTIASFDKVSLTWLGESSWVVALQGVLSYGHLYAVIDWNRKTVSISDKRGAATSSLATPVIPAISLPLKNNVSKSKFENKNPFSTDANIKPNSISATITKPVVTSPPPKTWSVSAGTTLKKVFTQWASENKCDLNKDWIIRWNTQTDYTIDSPLVFVGNFEKVTIKLFSLYRHANIPLYADGYKSQCLIVVSDKK